MKSLIICSLLFVQTYALSAKVTTTEKYSPHFDCNGDCASTSYLNNSLPSTNLDQLSKHMAKAEEVTFCGMLKWQGSYTYLIDYVWNPYYLGDPEESFWNGVDQSRCVCIFSQKSYDGRGHAMFGKKMYQAWNCRPNEEAAFRQRMSGPKR